MNSDTILVLIAEDHSIKHRIMEDISIEQKKSFLNREKGLELQTIYKILSFSPDYVTTKLSQGHPTSIFGKKPVRKTIWDLEFSEHLL